MFLGLIAFLGECFIKREDGKWFVPSIGPFTESNWVPLLEFSSGYVTDPFFNLWEGLHFYVEDKFMPIIDIEIDEIQAKPKKHFTHPRKRVRSHYYGYQQEMDYGGEEEQPPLTYIQELTVEQLKEIFLNEEPASVRHVDLPPKMSVYKLQNNKILLIMEPALKGFLYDSLEDLY